MDHAKCLRRIKWGFVNMFIQSRAMSWEEGWLFWLVNGILAFILWHFSLLLNCSEHSENWKKGKKKKKASSLLWKVTAEVDGMELLSLDNKTTNSGNNNYQKTVQAKFWPIFYNTLFICLKNQSRHYEKNRLFVIFCCCL